MLHAGRRCACLLAAAWLGAGCTTLREVPRPQYAARAERKGVVVETREGLEYRFDYAHFSADTLVGYRLRETEGPVTESHRFAIALEEVTRLMARRVDWLRTGALGGLAVAAAVSAATRGSVSESPPGSDPPLPGEP